MTTGKAPAKLCKQSTDLGSVTEHEPTLSSFFLFLFFLQKAPDRRLVWCYRHEPALRIFKKDQSGYLWSVTEHQTGLEYNYNYAEGQSGDLCSVTEHELALSIICKKDKAVTCVVLLSTRWP